MRFLSLKGSTYWFKRDIPKAIRGSFGDKTAWLVSLDTGDVRVAKDRRDDVEKECDAEFREARAGRVPRQSHKDTLAALTATWTKEVADYRTDPAQWTLRTFGERMDDRDALTPHDLMESTVERIEDEHGVKARDAFLSTVHGRVTVGHHKDAYLKEARDLAPKTLADRTGHINRFDRWATDNGYRLPSVNRKVAGEYVSDQIAPMDRRTGKKHLTSLKLYWEYLAQRGHVAGDENPWENQTTPQRGRRAARGGDERERPFTDGEMKAMLYPDADKTLHFAEQINDAMRISALSGMRLAEVVGLWVRDCSDDWFFVEEGKTSAARRRIPIHPDLKEIVSRRSRDRKPDERLFHELARERNPGDTFGKRFNRYRKALGVEDVREGKRRSLVNFHSFRRWFATTARHAGQPVEVVGQIMGHSTESQPLTFGVYTPGASDQQLRDCIEAVRLPKISTDASPL